MDSTGFSVKYVCIRRYFGEDRGCRLAGLKKVSLESALIRLALPDFSRKLSWKSGRESGSATVVVAEHAAQSLTACDLAV
jgi:hypothetical protein